MENLMVCPACKKEVNPNAGLPNELTCPECLFTGKRGWEYKDEENIDNDTDTPIFVYK